MGLISGLLSLFIFVIGSIIVIELLTRFGVITDIKRKKSYLYVLIYLATLAAITFAPIVINDALSSTSFTYKTATDLGNPQWLGFWGSYMGGVVSALAAVVAFFLTYRQNEKQHEETRRQMLEQQRMQVLPILSIKEIAYSYTSASRQGLYLATEEMPARYIFIDLHVTNISSNPALFFELEGAPKNLKGHLLPGQVDICSVGLPIIQGSRILSFKFLFSDSLGNKYQQLVTCTCQAEVLEKHESPYFSQPSFPQLVSNPSCKTDPSTRQPSKVDQ